MANSSDPAPNHTLCYSMLSLSATRFQSPLTALLTLISLYLILVQYLRNQRAKNHTSLFPTAASLTDMTPQQAHRINHTISTLEFPFTYEKALQFALFRTYGIPSISSLLCQTTQLSSPSTACKRYVDTEVLVAEFIGQDWGGERWVEGLARINSLHAGYVKAGKISQQDLLYTLSLFALEPVKWIGDWEWRALTDVEICAVGVYWKGVGDAMGISYEELPGWKKGWRNGKEWLADVRTWAEEYEKVKMVPARTNADVAEQTVAILLWHTPVWAKGWGKKIVNTLLYERLRRAMMYEDPPKWLTGIVHTGLYLRQFALRYLAVPRPRWRQVSLVSKEKSPEGNFHTTKYAALPYYVEPTLWNRFTPGTWLGRCLGLPVPGIDGSKYFPRGYKTSELGPSPDMGKADWDEAKDEVRSVGIRNCPISLEEIEK